MTPRSSNPTSEGDSRRFAPFVTSVGRFAAREMLGTAEVIAGNR
jgi:hypothetical protein